MNGQILSILSHVVHGYVGNRAVTFPLQYLGWDVDALNTTNLSNHPGYGKFSGTVEPAELIEKVLQGLEAIDNSIGKYDMILTGYLPNGDIVLAVKQAIYRLLENSHSSPGSALRGPKYIMDPILGDNGKIYVSKEVIPHYQEMLASGCVSLITPNQFEFELLTGVSIGDILLLKQAIIQFSGQFKVPDIVISSINLADNMYSVGYNKPHNQLFLIPIKEIPCKFFGCGDLFTALISHGYYKHGEKITANGLKDAVMKLTQVLQATYDNKVREFPGKEILVINDINVVGLADILLKDLTADDVDVTYIDL